MKDFTMPREGAAGIVLLFRARSSERHDATPGKRLRVTFHIALADARNALVALAHVSARTLAEINQALREAIPDRAVSIAANVDAVKAGARALASTAVDLMWKQQPFARDFESVLAMYELAIDYQRLADDLAALALDVLQADRTTLHGAPPHLQELADTALRSCANLHQGLRDETAGPLLRANSERTIADAIAFDSIAELQHALLVHSISTDRGCALLLTVMAFQRVIHQTATTARHGHTLLAETA